MFFQIPRNWSIKPDCIENLPKAGKLLKNVFNEIIKVPQNVPDFLTNNLQFVVLPEMLAKKLKGRVTSQALRSVQCLRTSLHVRVD